MVFDPMPVRPVSAPKFTQAATVIPPVIFNALLLPILMESLIPSNVYAPHRLPLPVRVAPLIAVPVLLYAERSLIVVVFSPNAAILSKLYIATNPLS